MPTPRAVVEHGLSLLERALGFLRRHSGKIKDDPYLLGLLAATESAVDDGPSRAMAMLAASSRLSTCTCARMKMRCLAAA